MRAEELEHFLFLPFWSLSWTLLNLKQSFTIQFIISYNGLQLWHFLGVYIFDELSNRSDLSTNLQDILITFCDIFNNLLFLLSIVLLFYLLPGYLFVDFGTYGLNVLEKLVSIDCEQPGALLCCDIGKPIVLDLNPRLSFRKTLLIVLFFDSMILREWLIIKIIKISE